MSKKFTPFEFLRISMANLSNCTIHFKPCWLAYWLRQQRQWPKLTNQAWTVTSDCCYGYHSLKSVMKKYCVVEPIFCTFWATFSGASMQIWKVRETWIPVLGPKMIKAEGQEKEPVFHNDCCYKWIHFKGMVYCQLCSTPSLFICLFYLVYNVEFTNICLPLKVPKDRT